VVAPCHIALDLFASNKGAMDSPRLLESSCHKVHQRHINNGSVKALLPAKGDILRLARVGSRVVACALLAFSGCKKNEPTSSRGEQ
jgi:hypothetical protein